MWEFPRTAIAPKDESGFKRWDSGLYRKLYAIKHAIALELNPKSILEIGVRAGYSAFSFLSACPTARYVGLDAENNKHGGQGGPWTPWAIGILKPYDATVEIANTQKLDTLEPYGRFAFIHVDGDHTTAGCAHDLRMAFGVLLPGGAVLVDDYRYLKSVRKAVDEFVSAYDLDMELRDSPRGEAILRRRNNEGNQGTGDIRREPAGQARRAGHGCGGNSPAGQGAEEQIDRRGGSRGEGGQGREADELQGRGQDTVPAAHDGELLRCGDRRREVPAHAKPLDLGPRVTLIMASRDEGDEVTRTCQSAIDNATGPIQIIVIDDGSVKPATVPSGVNLHRLEKPIGLFAAKRLAVEGALSEAVILTDAHVRFEPGWDGEFAEAVGHRPDAVHVAYSSGLMNADADPDWVPDVSKAKGTYYGANFVVRRNDPKKGLRILEGVWQGKRKEGAIPCPMGSVYGISKTWWNRVDMLAGLCVWGGQEPDMALRTWLAGGEVLLIPTVRTAHVFRKKTPYPSDPTAIWMNRMYMAAVLPPPAIGEALLNELASKHAGAARMFDIGEATEARKRFDAVRAPNSWDAWLERFPEIVNETVD